MGKVQEVRLVHQERKLKHTTPSDPAHARYRADGFLNYALVQSKVMGSVQESLGEITDVIYCLTQITPAGN